MTDSRALGDAAEAFAKKLLEARGYAASMLPTNSPTYDLEVAGNCRFYVSVKASRSRQHVRLGSLSTVQRLQEGSFVFAFMPIPGRGELMIPDGPYRLLIVPGAVARDDSIALHHSYHAARGTDPITGYSLIVKGYSRRQHQRDVWARWAAYEDAWSLLPPSSDLG